MTNFCPAPIKPTITAADLDLTNSTSASARSKLSNWSRVQNKLAKLVVEFGDRRRSVLASLRSERVDPKAEVEGRQALFVVNLAPRKMAGQVSEAMLLDIGYAEGITPVLAMPERPVPNGGTGGLRERGP